ncbi:MAG: hypothetical protein Q9192_006338, partial [Flavoplaca navasiana]
PIDSATQISVLIVQEGDFLALLVVVGLEARDLAEEVLDGIVETCFGMGVFESDLRTDL